MKVHTFIVFLSVLRYCIQQSDAFWLWGNDNKNKVDGKWSEWSNYSSCQLPLTDKDNFPYRFRTRNCNNPAPKAGGKPCKGQTLRKAPCSDCDWPLGIESKIIRDSKITASTFHEEFPAKDARLNGPSAWCAKELSDEVFLQVDFGGLTLVTAIATQGYYPNPKELSLRLGSVSKYQITFSDDGVAFEVYENAQKNNIFIGNGNNLNTVKNLFDPQIAASHIRIHPTAYIKFVCMKIELYGCRFKCGGYLPTRPGDLLAVSSESEDVDCFWQAHLPNSSEINFDFIKFDLPCKYGQVEVKGSYPFYGVSKSLGKFCHDHALSAPSIESKGKKLWIRFQSKSSDPLVGFYGMYFPSCDILLNSTTSGMFGTPGYPKMYNHNSKCTWSIIVPKGNIVKIEFLDFDIEQDPECRNDYLSISDTNSSKMEHYCNSKKPPRFVCSNSNVLRLHFKSDDVLALKGFQATYRAVKVGTPCITPLSSIITPSPSISSSTIIASTNFTLLSSARKITPTTAGLLPSIIRDNNSIGVLLTGGGVLSSGDGNQPHKKDEEDTGLTTIIIISVFSFIVLCMIIVSVIPSMIHGYEKRKREREWMVADLAVKKNNVVENEYEMQPIKPLDRNENDDMEPNEETVFLDPDNPSYMYDDVKDSPCFDVTHKEDTTSASQGDLEYSNKVESLTGDPREDLECELEYDTTDLNLSASYEDIGSSFATEMAALMHNYKSTCISPLKDSPTRLQQPGGSDQSIEVAKESKKQCNQKNGKNEKHESNNKRDNMKEKDQANENLDSDSCSTPEIEHPETFTNSTVSVTDSQDIPSVPYVRTCQNTMIEEENRNPLNGTNTDVNNEITTNKAAQHQAEFVNKHYTVDVSSKGDCEFSANFVPETVI